MRRVQGLIRLGRSDVQQAGHGWVALASKDLNFVDVSKWKSAMRVIQKFAGACAHLSGVVPCGQEAAVSLADC